MQGVQHHACLKVRKKNRRITLSIRELAHVIGLIISSFPAFKPARLYYRLSSSDGYYNSIVYLSQLAKDSLPWVVLNIHLHNVLGLQNNQQ